MIKNTTILTIVLISLITAITGEGVQLPIHKIEEYLESHYSDKIVAATLILEAGGEYADGSMESVNEVIVNRSLKRNIPETQVCLQKYQFSCWNDKTIQEGILKAMKHPRWNTALDIVKRQTTNLTKGADHYHADYIKNPYWAKSMIKTVKIGRHIFYRSSLSWRNGPQTDSMSFIR